jgi:hypothetical protein
MGTAPAILAAMARTMRGTHHPTIDGRKGMMFQDIPHSLIKNKVFGAENGISGCVARMMKKSKELWSSFWFM